jgi:hypothetical protein
MATSKQVKWLWLEDEPQTVRDIQELIFRGYFMKKNSLFYVPGKLLKKLIEIKNSKRENLNDYALILDIMLKGNPILYSPKSWNGEEDRNISTDNGSDAGLKFYEKIILNIQSPKLLAGETEINPFWSPPPPIIFLSVLHPDKVQPKLNEIKSFWAFCHKTTVENTKVAFLNKFDLNYKSMANILKTWDILPF